MTIDILDCTLRDGGYQNAWDFADPLVSRYLRALDKTGCRYVEMGYRASPTDSLAGRYRYSPDHLIRAHCAGLRLKAAVMIDGKTMCNADGMPDLARLESLFCAQEQSPVHMVRIAATAEIVRPVSAICAWLKDRGYAVAINLMQASTLAISRIRDAGTSLDGSGADFVYLADSFGGLTPDATIVKIATLASAFRGRVGFHAHDNMGLAFANTLAAIGAGATIVDSSMLGMGRGAGNLRTEQLLGYLEKTGRSDIAAAPLFDLIATDFASLQAEYRWGPTLPYLVTGINDIHPTYAQTLLSNSPGGAVEVLRTLEALSFDPARTTYNATSLDTAMKRGSATMRRLGTG